LVWPGGHNVSRLTELISRTKSLDPTLGNELEREFRVLASRRPFGLNFERHRPESVELPNRVVRRGDKVRILPQRGARQRKDERLWRVLRLAGDGEKRTAEVVACNADQPEKAVVAVADLVVVAEFRDYIYPGLVRTGRVQRGGDKPFHTVINGENYHVLEALSYTHRGKIDAIYIDPPFNSGATDWKYNNSYVEQDDLYRHSKWLAMMERRLLVAKSLLNPLNSVLIVAIDAREYLRLGLLLEQTFPEARIQMISTIINPKGVSVVGGFRRADEYIYVAMLGAAAPARLPLSPEWSPSSRVSGQMERSVEQNESTADAARERQVEPGWTSMMRRGTEASRADRPAMFYPIYADPEARCIVDVGEPVPVAHDTAPDREGLVTILPIRRDGTQGRWQISAQQLRERLEQGRVRLGRATAYGFVVNYLPDGAYREALSDAYEVVGKAADGSLIAHRTAIGDARMAPTQWKIASHNASEYGSGLLAQFIPGRQFPFPKSLYAVEDALRFFVKENPDAVILDFFAGSGTTAHAVMRLNRQDGGRRQCISVTNNEVAAEEQAALHKAGLRQGDPDWEKWGICDYITKPRIAAAITGMTPDGSRIAGDYRFTDEFPMREGFDENAEFFTLTYESSIAVSHNLAFQRIAPLLWMRAGAQGRCIDDLPVAGWELVETYGLLVDLDRAAEFRDAVAASTHPRIAYVVTDDDRRFQAVARSLPPGTEPVRLYESYLINFRLPMGR